MQRERKPNLQLDAEVYGLPKAGGRKLQACATDFEMLTISTEMVPASTSQERSDEYTKWTAE
jgi:hypothetical protein